MGIVRNQSILSSLSFYIGMLFGAINTVILYPNVFKENPEYFGLIQILLAYAIVVSAFTTLGIPKIFVRFFPEVKEKGQLYLLSLLTPLVGFVFAFFIYILFKEQIFSFLNPSNLLKENFFYIILLVFFIGFYDVLTSISRSFLSATVPIFINEVFLKLYSMSILFVYWFGYVDFTTFLKIYLLGYLIKFMLLLFIQLHNNRIYFSFSLKDLQLREMLSYGSYVLVSGITIIVVTRIDMVMIGNLLDLKQVAFYTVAFFIGNSIMIPAKSISAISVPLIAKAWGRRDLDEIQIIYQKSSINQLIIGGIFFLCIWLSIDEIFSFFPDNFRVGKWVVFYIGISQLFNMSTGVNGEIIVNSDYYRYDFFTSIFLVFITIATNLVLIPEYGINGAGMATAVSIFLFNLIRLIIIKVHLNFQPFTFKTILTVLLLLGIYFALYYLIPNSGYALLDIFFNSLTAILLFTPSVLYLGLSEDILEIINSFKRKWIS